MTDLKRRKPNWRERELLSLAEAVVPKVNLLKSKFSPSITAEWKHEAWCEIATQ
jgi:hypothetical protein